jgi:hypothetical protein
MLIPLLLASALLPATTGAHVCPPPRSGHAACDLMILVTRRGHHTVHPRVVRARTAAAAGAPEPQAGSPAWLQQAYDLESLSATRGGGGDTIAIVEGGGDSTAEADLGVFRSTFGLGACTTQNGCFRRVDQNGGTSYPPDSMGWSLETSLDLEAASSLCPLCKLVLVQAASSAWTNLLAADNEAHALGAGQISDSWTAVPSGTLNANLITYSGVDTVVSSGDYGYSTGEGFPSMLPGVTAAGGTTLTAADGARGFGESAWAHAGSGCSTQWSKPAWQTDTGCTKRASSDISADADPATGLLTYASAGGWYVGSGTSLSAPLVAAYYALTGAQSPAWAYAHAAQLNDVVSGSNAASCTFAYLCTAGPGYDGPTGVGAISGAAVSGAPGIGGPGPSGNYVQAVGSGSAVLGGGVYPNVQDTSWWAEYGTDTGYGQRTQALDVGAGTAAVPVTATLSGLAPGTVYHARLVAQNSAGTTGGYDSTLTTAPVAPVVLASAATATAWNTATFSATVNPGGAPTSVVFRYGNAQSAPAAVSGTAPAPVSVTVGGLAPATVYRFSATASNAAGSAAGAAATFTTPHHPPVAATPRVSRVGSSSATIASTVNGEHAARTTWYLLYGTSARRLTKHTSMRTLPKSGRVGATLSGLRPRTTYYVRVVAANDGGAAQSAARSFRTR